MTGGALAALLRGVNVAGHGRLRMAELRDLAESVGLDDVRSYRQSGNLVFRSDDSGDEVAARLSDALREHAGLDTTVVIRSHDDLARVVDANPLAAHEDDPRRLHVMFLAAEPSTAAIERLDPRRSPRDRFVVQDREMFVYYPDGSGRSKLTLDYVERTLGTIATGRNWNTVLALRDMTAP